VREACAGRLATRAQVATAISKRRSIPIADDIDRTPTPFERPTPDPAMSAAETMESGRSAAMTMDERPRIDPGRTADLRSRAARLRDESEHESASPAVRLRDKSHVIDRADDEIRLRDKSHVVERESDDDLRKTSEHPSGARRLREHSDAERSGSGARRLRDDSEAERSASTSGARRLRDDQVPALRRRPVHDRSPSRARSTTA
jgi:hypothetical protein